MIKKLRILLVLLPLLATPTYANSTTAINKVIARVNNSVITSNDLAQRIKFAEYQFNSANQPVPNAEKLKSDMLNDLIDTTLQLQIAKRANVSVSNTELNNRINAIVKRNNADIDALKTSLNKSGLTYAMFRKQVRESMILQKIQAKAVSKDINISDSEIKNIQALWKQEKVQPEYELQDLFIEIPDNASKAQLTALSKKASALKAKIKADTDLDALATDASTADITVTLNDLGWRKASAIPTLFAKAVSNMKTGATTGPIKAPNGYHIVKLVSIRSNNKALTDNQARQIIFGRKYQQNLMDWIEQLHNQSYINRM